LNRFEQVAVEDCGMLSWVNFAPMHDIADVEPVAEQIGEGSEEGKGSSKRPEH